MFTFCCPHVCRLSFCPYVIRLTLGNCTQVREGSLTKRAKAHEPEIKDKKPPIGELNLSASEARTLYGICVELLELCSNVSGKIDPEAGWMVAHARDEVMLSIFDVRS